MDSPVPERVLLKVSGESLSGEGEFGVNGAQLSALADELASATGDGAQIALVVGAGNFVRGQQIVGAGIERVPADFMGMLATVMNGLAIQSALAVRNVPARVLSALPACSVVEPYSPPRCVELLEAGRLVILVGGTGNPYFTTDTSAALRAAEIGASWLLKGTKVDGVYSGDPKTDDQARRFDKITYPEVLGQRLQVMDATAIALCMDTELPIRVFDMFGAGNIRRAVLGESLGTVVLPEGREA